MGPVSLASGVKMRVKRSCSRRGDGRGEDANWGNGGDASDLRHPIRGPHLRLSLSSCEDNERLDPDGMIEPSSKFALAQSQT